MYVNDMLVKSLNKENRIRDLKQMFGILRNYKMKLNLAKCTFNLGCRKFFGFIVNHRAIEANAIKSPSHIGRKAAQQGKRDLEVDRHGHCIEQVHSTINR